MHRMDARVSTDLSAKIQGLNQSLDTGEPIVLKQLSLSGALLQGVTPKDELLCINPGFSATEQFKLCGRVVRSYDDYAALHFLTSDLPTLSTLWKLIKNRLSVDQECPFCGFPLLNSSQLCSSCNNSLDFSDQLYLEKHLRKTYSGRLEQQLEQISMLQLQKFCRLAEAESSSAEARDRQAQLIGRSAAMEHVVDFAREAAQGDGNLLFTGEAGVGKKFIARAIHNLSARRFRPFVVVDAAAMPSQTLETKVFGYQQGAFSGAKDYHQGLLELADGGTLVFVGIEKFHPGFQARLLTFFEEKSLERFGSRAQHVTNVRVVLTASQDWSTFAAEPFFTRVQTALSPSSLHIPALREREDDSLLLAERFAEQYGWGDGRINGFSAAAQEKLRIRSWQRNIDELHSLVKAVLEIAEGPLIEVADLKQASDKLLLKAPVLKEQVNKSQRETVLTVLEENNYVISRTARALGVTRPTLYDLMKKLDIQRK